MELKPYLWLAIVTASLAGLLFGVNTGNIAGALPFIRQHFHSTVLQDAWIVSSTILFAFLSASCSAKMCRTYGHRKILIWMGLCFFVGASLAGGAHSLIVLFLARSLLGIAIGISSYAAPLYIAEIVPADYRGFFVLINGVAITGGEAIAFLVDYECGKYGQWQFMLWWSIFPAFIFFVGMLFMPCAPRWLLAHGKKKAAEIALKKFHSTKRITPLLLEMEKVQQATSLSLRKIWLNIEYRKPLLIGISLGVFQQFFGINAVMYYGPFIFEKAGFSLMSLAIWVTFIMGVVNMLTTVLTGLVVDVLGRRFMLLFGAALACISLLMIAGLFYFNTKAPSWTMVSFMLLYMVGYCMSVGSLFWLIIAEIFPLSIRDQGASLAAGIQWLSNFVVSLTFLPMLQYLGACTTFLVYSMICFLAVIFVYYKIPETSKISLEALFQEKLCAKQIFE